MKLRTRKTIQRTALAILGVVFTILNLTACDSTVVVSGGTYGGGHSDPYRRAWYDVYGQMCSSYGYPTAGCNFYADGSKITASQDPYYNLGSMLYYDYWTYTDSYGFRRTYLGYAWLSNTGILYDDFGNALNEIENEESDANIIKARAKKEQRAVQTAAKSLAKSYGLSQVSGVRIAKTLQDWALIGRNRSRTAEDVADVSKRLFGVELKDASSAIVKAAKGDQKEMVELNIDVSAHWGTTPEVSKRILKNWYKDEMAQLGIQ